MHTFLLLLTCCWYGPLAAEGATSVSEGRRDDRGSIVHEVRCEYQSQPTLIRVLLPDESSDGPLPVIYVLPVEAGTGTRYGDGLEEVRKQGLHNKHRVVFVSPTFAHLPWYADHPTDPGIRQESYLLKVVLPLVERHYNAKAEPSGRLLLGFSKSGWGAWTLLLRHPDVFGRAAAWDAPLAMNSVGRYGSEPIFGSAENFHNYEVFTLLERQAALLRSNRRLILLGRGGFAADLAATHQRLTQLQIAHVYRDGPERKHDWHSGWLGQAVELLLSPNE